MPKARTLDLGTGVRVPCVETGDPAGIPVLCLHGFTDSLESFGPMAKLMPRSIRMIAFSQRGHGDADRPDGGYAPADFAKDAIAVLDALGIDKAVVLGHSMGSFVAQCVARDAPERVLGLVLIGSFASLAGNAAVQEFWDTAIAGLTDPVDRALAHEFQTGTLAKPIDPAFLALVVDESMKPPARVWRATLRGLLDAQPAAVPGGITAPTLILWGDEDAFFPAPEQARLRAAVPKARFETYVGFGHAPHWEEPARVARDVAGFVARIA